jgi:hypothetical protein
VREGGGAKEPLPNQPAPTTGSRVLVGVPALGKPPVLNSGVPASTLGSTYRCGKQRHQRAALHPAGHQPGHTPAKKPLHARGEARIGGQRHKF